MKTVQFPPEIGTPGINHRTARHYVGLRIITPFEGMFAQSDKLFKELRQWVNTQDVADQGPYFLRTHTPAQPALLRVEQDRAIFESSFRLVYHSALSMRRN